MKILGIGVDVVNNRRIQPLIKNQNFIKRTFGPNELKFSKNKVNRTNFFAKRFAAKEAVMKSLGKGWRQLSWKDIEISGGGKPEVILYGKAKNLAKELNIENVHVSLSHEEDKAIAFTISEIEK